MSLTRADLQARATERAKGLRTWRLMNGQFAVKSRQLSPGSFHLVTLGSLGEARCDCPGFYYRAVCPHSAAVNRRVERERRAAFAF